MSRALMPRLLRRSPRSIWASALGALAMTESGSTAGLPAKMPGARPLLMISCNPFFMWW